MSKLIESMTAEEKSRAWRAFIMDPGVNEVLCDWFNDGPKGAFIGLELSEIREKCAIKAIRESYGDKNDATTG